MIAAYKTEVEFRGSLAQDLKSFSAPGRWTKWKQEAFSKLVDRLAESGYQRFSSSAVTVGLYRKGQSAIYKVPVRQRGALSSYEGKFVHIVCVARKDNYSGRIFAVAEVSDSGWPVGNGGAGLLRRGDPGSPL